MLGSEAIDSVYLAAAAAAPSTPTESPPPVVVYSVVFGVSLALYPVPELFNYYYYYIVTPTHSFFCPSHIHARRLTD